MEEGSSLMPGPANGRQEEMSYNKIGFSAHLRIKERTDQQFDWTLGSDCKDGQCVED